jgi:hypothetical protein
MSKLIRTWFLFCLSVALGVFISFGCSSSGSSIGSTGSGDTVNLTGIVNAPSVITDIATPMKGFAGKAVTETAVNGVTCHAYTLEGEDLGTCVTDAAGTCSIAADLATLKGANDTGTAWNEPFVIDCDNGIQVFDEADIDEAAPADQDTGTLNTNTTLATQGVAGEITGFDGWGPAYALPAGVDLQCVFEAQKALWTNAALTGSGIADDNGILKETIEAFMAAGGTPADAGYENWHDMMQAIIGGNAGDNWPAIAGIADDYIDDAYDPAIANGYAGAVQAFAAVDGVLDAQFGEGGYGIAALASIAKAEGSGSVCDQLKAGTLDAAVIVGPLLAIQDVETFTNSFKDNCMAAMMAMVQDCTANSTCEGFESKPAAFAGMFEGYGGTCDGLYDGTTFNDDALSGFVTAAGQCTATTPEDYYKCGMATQGFIDAAGWETVETNGELDPEKIAFWQEYYMNLPNYDPEQTSAEDYMDVVNMADDSSMDAVEQCKLTTPEEQWITECYGLYLQGEQQIGAAPMAGIFSTDGSTCTGNLLLPATLTISGTAPSYASIGNIVTFTWSAGTSCSNVTLPGNQTALGCVVTGSGEAGSKITITTDPNGTLYPPQCDIILTKLQ